MLIDNNYMFSGLTTGKSSEEDKKTADEFAKLLGQQTAKDTILEITKNGMSSYWEWQVEQLKEKIAAEVMDEMGVTKESIDAMSGEDKVALQKRIMDEVAKRLEQVMVEEAKKNRQEGKNELGSQAAMVTPQSNGPDKSFIYLTNSVL